MPSRPALSRANAKQIIARAERRVGVAIHADDLGGDPLANLGFVQRFHQDHHARVGVEVDEAGGDGAAGGIDATGRRVRGGIAPQDRDSRSPFVPTAPSEAGRAGAVDDDTVFDEQVEVGHQEPAAWAMGRRAPRTQALRTMPGCSRKMSRLAISSRSRQASASGGATQLGIDGDQVRFLADFDGADDVTQAQRLRAPERAQTQPLERLRRRW